MLTHTLASNAAEALYMMDAHGRVTFMNPAAERMFGWSRGESLGRVLHDLIHYKHEDGSPFPMSTCPLGQVMTTGATLAQHEDLFVHRDGSFVPVYCSNAAVVADGDITGAVLVVHEITAIRTREEELRRRAARLSVEASRKDDFLAMLAHELRNPLAAMTSAIELLRRDPAPAERARALEVLERQARQQRRLVDDLLDVSRVTRGKLVLQRVPLDLAAVVAGCVEDHRRAFAELGVALELALPPASLPISGDATRVAQIAANLLSNAGKFTPRGGRVVVTVAARDGVAELRVQDTGVGIAEEFLPTIFEPFTQGDRVLDRAASGLGLGLAVVKTLAELHEGSVRIDSARGRGTEVVVTLPLQVRAPVAVAAPEPAQHAAPRRILLVEDDADLADTLSALLELSGHTVVVARDGAAGVSIARRRDAEVILCDLGLPVIDGYALARALRADGVTTKLVALSGYGQAEDRARAFAAGFDLHLTKPVDLDELARVLAAL